MKVLCLWLPEEENLTRVAEALLQLSPQVAVGEEALFLEVGALGKITTVEAVAAEAEALLQRFGLEATMSVAEDIPTSLCLAKYAVLKKTELPVHCLNDYLSPFRRTEILNAMVLAMQRLGVCCLGDFLKLSSFEITSRFGKEGLLALQRVQQSHLVVWPYFKRQEQIFEEKTLEFSVTELEPLLFSLKQVLNCVAARLKGRGEHLSLFQLQLLQEDYAHLQAPKRAWQISLARPLRSTGALLNVIKERLARDLQLKALEAPVIKIEFTVLESVAAYEAQKNFFDKREEQKEAFAELVAKLCAKLGEKSAFKALPRASYCPERAWEKVLTDEEKREFNFPERPLRVLKSPVPLKREQETLRTTGRHWRIQDFVGPERISGEWWKAPFQRDYFKVSTREGEELWVFKEHEKLYLHGYFD